MTRRPRTTAALLAAGVCLLLLASAHADPKSDLAQTQKALAQSKAQRAELAAESYALQAELKRLQKDLVTSAEAIQSSESELSAMEEKLRQLDLQLHAREVALDVHRAALVSLISAALRLSHMPPEAAIMMPGDAVQAMEASRALEMTRDSIKQEAASLRQQMSELSALKATAAKEHDDAQARHAELDKARQELAGRLSERRAVQAQLDHQQQEEKQKAQALAKKATGLQDLLAALDRQEKEAARKREEAKRAAAEAAAANASQPSLPPNAAKGRLRPFVAAKGHVRPPVTGRVVRMFGTTEGRNETSKGIAIATRQGAQVVAPYDGEVVFTGPFLNYGRIVIIRHSDDFHTLLAGLEKIDVTTGEFLLEGEPIGAMGEAQLYVELRKDNQPIDPAPWISGLSKKNEE